MAAETNLSSDLIRAQLQRVLASKPFRASELQKQFLTYVVRLTLEGKTGEIKEYAIGAEAFHRGMDFDPRIDSVVRVVARRVRERLSEFYTDEGKDDSLLIQLSPGSYVPSFSIRDQSATIPDPAPLLTQSSDQPGLRMSAETAATSRRATLARLIFSLTLVLVAAYFIFRPGAPPKITAFHQLTRDGQAKLGAFALGVPAPLVSDGSRLYFEEVVGSEVVVAEAATPGGETVPIQTGFEKPLVLMDLSPDRSQLLLKNFFEDSLDGALFKMSLPGGAPRPLANLTAHDASWAPDGAHICYVNGNRLYVARADGTESKSIASLPGEPSWPRWSPDGARIRLTVQDDKGGTSLWEVSSTGANLHALLPNWDDHPSACCGSWSPDGKYFVFQATQFGVTSLWAIRETQWPFGRPERQPVRLTQGPLDVSAPLFSADGRKIFAVVRQRRGELVRYDASQHDFRLYLRGMSADHVEFSKDSQWTAYSTYPEEEIWRSRPNGSQRLQLSSAPMTAIFPRWSPNGRQIAFMGTKPGGPVKIYLVPANGGDPEPVLPGSAAETDPNWSPDGNEIMFAMLPSVNGVAKSRPVIQIVDLKSRKVSTLPGSEGLQAPRWSPDGRFVVATALSEGKWADPAVVIFDFKTSKWTGFEKDPIDNKWWSADGKYFYFDKLIDNDPAIYRLWLSDLSWNELPG